MTFFNGHETLDPYVYSIHKASCPPFGVLKMISSNLMSILAEEYMASVEQLFVISAA